MPGNTVVTVVTLAIGENGSKIVAQRTHSSRCATINTGTMGPAQEDGAGPDRRPCCPSVSGEGLGPKNPQKCGDAQNRGIARARA